MAIAIGKQLGSHEITALLGRGGMGQVYRALDMKLKRDVAIKILPEEFSWDPDRVNCFHREAEVLASLNHPNIATKLFGRACSRNRRINSSAETVMVRCTLPRRYWRVWFRTRPAPRVRLVSAPMLPRQRAPTPGLNHS